MIEGKKQFNVFETMKELRKYVEGNYVANGEIFTVKEPYIKDNPLSKALRAEADSIPLDTKDIQKT